MIWIGTAEPFQSISFFVSLKGSGACLSWRWPLATAWGIIEMDAIAFYAALTALQKAR